MAAPQLQLETGAGKATLRVSGDWLLASLQTFPAFTQTVPADAVLDGAALTALDTSGALILLQLLQAAGLNPEQPVLANFSAPHAAVLNLVAANFAASSAHPTETRMGWLAHLGRSSCDLFEHIAGIVNFVGALSTEMLDLLRHPAQFRGKEFAAQLEAVFVNAIPLAFAMMFLLGLVFAYLLGIQAQQYGANIFVVDGVALAVGRELAPVIVAILVAGRSGAAMTAEIGSMKANDEVDAISVLGLSPYLVLVLPRLLALLVALPLLVFIGDLAGMLGGMLVAAQQLDIGMATFISRLNQVLDIQTIMLGLIKAPVFALSIGLIACRMGLSVERDARSVGAHTTSTVVQSIVAVIVLNAIFAVAYVQLGY